MNALEKSQQGAEKSVQPTVGQFLNSAPAPAPAPAPAQPTSDVPTLPLPEDLETYPTPEAEVLPGPEVTKPEEAYPGVDVAGGARTSSVLAPSKIFDIAEPPAFAPPSLPSFVGVAKQIDLANINQGTIPGTPYDFTGQWLSNLRRDSSSVSFSDPAFSSVSRQATSRAGNWFQRLLFGSDGTIRGDGSVDTFNFMGMNLPDEGIFGNLLTGIRVGVGLIPGLTADTTRMMYSAIDPARTFGQARRMAYDWGLDKLNPASPYFAPGDWLNTVRVNLGDGPDRPQWYGQPSTEPTPPVVPPDRFLERFEATRPSATSETFTGALAKGEIPFFGLTDVRGGADGNQAFNPYAQYTREEVESWNQRDLAQQMARFRERSEQRNLSRQENPLWYTLAFGPAGAVLAGRSESVRNVYNAILEVPYAITDYFRAGVGVAASNPGAAVKVFATTTADVLLDPSPIIGSVDLGADIALSVMRSINPETATRLGRRIEDINIPVVNRSLSDMTSTIRVPGFGRVQARPEAPSVPVDPEPVTVSTDQLQVDMPPLTALEDINFSNMSDEEVIAVSSQIRKDYGVTHREAMRRNPALRQRLLEIQEREVLDIRNRPVRTVRDEVREAFSSKSSEVYQAILRVRADLMNPSFGVTPDAAGVAVRNARVVAIEQEYINVSNKIANEGVTLDSITRVSEILEELSQLGTVPTKVVKDIKALGLQVVQDEVRTLQLGFEVSVAEGKFIVPEGMTIMSTLERRAGISKFESSVLQLTNSIATQPLRIVRDNLNKARKALEDLFGTEVAASTIMAPIRLPTWRLDQIAAVYNVDLSQLLPAARNLGLLDGFDNLITKSDSGIEPVKFQKSEWNLFARDLIRDHRNGLMEDLLVAKSQLADLTRKLSSTRGLVMHGDWSSTATTVSRLERALGGLRFLEQSLEEGVALPQSLISLMSAGDSTVVVNTAQLELNFDLPDTAFVAAESILEGLPFPDPSAITMPSSPAVIEKTLATLAKAFDAAKKGVPTKDVGKANKEAVKRGRKTAKSAVEAVHIEAQVDTQIVPQSSTVARVKAKAKPNSTQTSPVKVEKTTPTTETAVEPTKAETPKKARKPKKTQETTPKTATPVVPKKPTQAELRAAWLEKIQAYKALPLGELYSQLLETSADNFTFSQLKELAKSRAIEVGSKNKEQLFEAILANMKFELNWSIQRDVIGRFTDSTEVHAGSSAASPAIPAPKVDEAVEVSSEQALEASLNGQVMMTRADADSVVRNLIEVVSTKSVPARYQNFVESGQVKLTNWYAKPEGMEGQALLDDFFTQFVESVNSIYRVFSEQLDYLRVDEASGVFSTREAGAIRASLLSSTQAALTVLNDYVRKLDLPFKVPAATTKNWGELTPPKLKGSKTTPKPEAPETPVKPESRPEGTTKKAKSSTKPGTGWYKPLKDSKGEGVTDLEELSLDLDDQFAEAFLNLRGELTKKAASTNSDEALEKLFQQYVGMVDNAKEYAKAMAVSLGLDTVPDYSNYKLTKPTRVNTPKLEAVKQVDAGEFSGVGLEDLQKELDQAEKDIEKLFSSGNPPEKAVLRLYDKIERIESAIAQATEGAKKAYSRDLVSFSNVSKSNTWVHSQEDLARVVVKSGDSYSDEIEQSLKYVHPELLKAVDWEQVTVFSELTDDLPSLVREALESSSEFGGFSVRVGAHDYLWVNPSQTDTPILAHEAFHTLIRQHRELAPALIDALDSVVLETYPAWDSVKPFYDYALSEFKQLFYKGFSHRDYFENSKFNFAEQVDQLYDKVASGGFWADEHYTFWLGFQAISKAWLDAAGYDSFRILRNATITSEDVSSFIGKGTVEELLAYRINWNPDSVSSLFNGNPLRAPDALTVVNKDYTEFVTGVPTPTPKTRSKARKPIPHVHFLRGLGLERYKQLSSDIPSGLGRHRKTFSRSNAFTYFVHEVDPSMVSRVLTLYHDKGTKAGFEAMATLLQYMPTPVLELLEKTGTWLIHGKDVPRMGGLFNTVSRGINGFYMKSLDLIATKHDPMTLAHEVVHMQFNELRKLPSSKQESHRVNIALFNVLEVYRKTENHSKMVDEFLGVLKEGNNKALQGGFDSILGPHFPEDLVFTWSESNYTSYGANYAESLAAWVDAVSIWEFGATQRTSDGLFRMMNFPGNSSVSGNLPVYHKKHGILDEVTYSDPLAGRYYREEPFAYLLTESGLVFESLFLDENLTAVEYGELVQELTSSFLRNKAKRKTSNKQVGSGINKDYADYQSGSQPIKFDNLLDQNAKLAQQIASESDLVPNGVTLGEDSSLAASVGNSKPIEALASRLRDTGGADVVLPESVTAGYTKQDHSPSLIESVMAQYYKEGTTSGFYRVKAMLDYVPGSVLTSFYKEGLTLLHLDDLRQLEGLADHFVRLQNDPMYISFGNILVTSDDIGVLTKEMNHVEASLDDVADILGQLEPYRNDPLLQAVGLNLPKFQKKVLEGHSELSLKDRLADWLLRMYQDLGYMWINQLLRKGPTYFADLYPNADVSERAFFIKKGEILSRLIPHIDEALNSAVIAPTMQQDKVYRGFTNPKLSFKKGDVVSHPFYLSTSQELTVAQGFSGPESWLFEIKGVKGPKLVKDFESEVLLPRNTELRVTDVQGYKVTLEYIGPPVNPKRKALLEGTAEPTAKPVEPEPTKTEDGPKPLESFVEGATSAEDVYKAYYVANSGGEKAWNTYKSQMTGLKGEKGWNKVVNDWFKKYKKTTGVDIKFSRTLSRPANLSESTAIGEPAYASYDTGTEKLRLTRTDEEVGSTNAGVNRQGGLGTGSSVSASSPDVGNSVDTRQFGTTNDYGPGVYATTSRDRAAQYANSIGHTKPGTVYGNPSVDSYRVKPGTTYARTTQRWLDLHTRRDYDGLAKLNQEALDAGIQVLITPKEDFIILDPNAVDHSGRSAIEPLDSAYAMRVSEYNARMDSGLPTDEIRMAAAEQGIFELGKHYEDILVSAGNKWFDEASAELGEFTNLRQQAKQDLKGVSTVSEQFSKAWEETQKCL